MDSDFGDLRVIPEAPMGKCSKEKLCSGESYQCASSFLVNGKIMNVSFDGQRIWAEDPENTDTRSEILRGLAFEVTFAGDETISPQGQPTGFVLYRYVRRRKFTFRCLEPDPARLDRWFSIFRAHPIAQIGMPSFYRMDEHSSTNGQFHKVIRLSDGKPFCAKFVPGPKFEDNPRTLKEIDISRQFPLPEVMKVEGYFLQKRGAVLITEWIAHSLADYLPPRSPEMKLSLPEFKYMMFVLMKALAEIHHKKIGHFSIIKEHIMVREDKTPVLVGFQDCKTTDYAARLLKKHSAPPKRNHIMRNEDDDYENCDMRLNFPLEADVFTVGLIIFEFFTGQQLFKGCILVEESNHENIIRWSDLEAAEQATPQAITLLQRMLHRTRVKRAHFGNLVPHKFFSEYTVDEKKKRRDRVNPTPKQIQQRGEFEVFDQYGDKQKKKIKKETPKPTCKRLKNGRFISEKKRTEEEFEEPHAKSEQPVLPYSVIEIASREGKANEEQQNALYTPEQANPEDNGGLIHNEEEGMESEEVDDCFSYIESLINDHVMPGAESMEDWGASMWGQGEEEEEP